MDGTREKKRRFHLKKGSWIANGGKGWAEGRGGWRMERSSKASSIPTDNAVATDIENGFSVARCVYVNILGVPASFFFLFSLRKKMHLLFRNAVCSRYFSVSLRCKER